MPKREPDAIDQLTEQVVQRIEALVADLNALGCTNVKFRVGGNYSGMEKSRGTVDGVTHVHLKKGRIDLDFHVGEDGK